MTNIGFQFNGNQVLHNVDFSIRSGEIKALLGGNGAGKSTLVKILGGILPIQEGSISIDGNDVILKNAKDSLQCGISFIHQELNLIDDLTVYENIFLSEFETKGVFLNRQKMIRETKALFDKLEIDINPKEIVGHLDVSCKQIVEICRSLLHKCKIIIMDEPTTSLTKIQVENIFGMCRKLREEGVGFIFISHKLNEVMEFCDSYTVLRNGSVYKTGEISDVSIKTLSESLVGHAISEHTYKRDFNYGKEVLRLENLSDGKYFNDINLSVKEGQILGVTGLVGDGKSQLFLSVFGARSKRLTGKIYFLGEEIKPKTTEESLSRGIAYVPSDRKTNAIVKDMSVLENMTIVSLKEFLQGLFIQKGLEGKKYSQEKENFSIICDNEDHLITTLSGGNQQKIVISKWLLSKPKLLILDNPTQGVDIEAKAEIIERIREIADTGVAVIWLSSDSSEIINTCDNTYVMFRGEIKGFLEKDDFNESNIMKLATGGNSDD